MESWNYIVEFYRKLAKDEEWKDFLMMEKFVKNLITTRNLNGLFPHTSHMALFITKSEKYEQWVKEPSINIDLNFGASEKYLYKLNFAEPIEDNEFIRKKEETVLCSFDKSLEIFDEMVEKLKAFPK